jgi:RNA polymerase sigma-70 factor (ECF subfamily)
MAGSEAEAARTNAPGLDFRELVDAHGDRLLRAAYFLCGDKTEAQDLAQETFLQAAKSASRYRGESGAYTWLYSILRHLCHHHFRKRKRLTLEPALLDSESVEPTPGVSLDADYRSIKLAQALRELSLEHREVVVLRYYEELKIQEIAARTSVSEGTVKSRLHHATRRLRQLLPGEMNVSASRGTES